MWGHNDRNHNSVVPKEKYVYVYDIGQAGRLMSMFSEISPVRTAPHHMPNFLATIFLITIEVDQYNYST